ncbi:DUF7922 domain-containing protein [Clostridium sp. ZS2-4]|uniref:DUF7922 domain-containing protein n=1 Tax=Clostridium sp. ZS2-4 TaxID=2987703 RepID=UPI00227C038A|nr:hypothetical protein [Clostridium sp. ZS2-4]MCY6355702.1 hypothetical protein [Clostridium sp. ZS2-4]
MSAKKNYSRYFIILQEDEKGFSIDANKFPTGYTKIEKKNNKCKISYYVQNLNKSKEPYYMILICSKKSENKLIKLGKMNIDDYGRSEISYEYGIENIANSGISMDKIKGAAIVHFQETSMRAVLTGFISGTRLEEWKKYSIVENKEQLREDKNETDEQIDKSNDDIKKSSDFEDNRDIVKDKAVKEEIKTKIEKIEKIDNKNKSENNIFDEYEKNIEMAKNINSNNRELNDADINQSINENESDDITDALDDVDDTNSERHSNENKTAKEIDDTAELEDYRGEDTRNKDKEKYKDKCECECECECEDNYKDKYECKCKEKFKEKYEYNYKDKYKDNGDNKDYPVGTLGEFFKNLAKDLEEVTDVCSEIGKCKWYKVPAEKLENINDTSDLDKYTILYYPMICYYPYIKKHGHYLVGYKCDSKGRMRYLVYAIPGTKIMNDQPFGGATGFTTWVCKDHTEDKIHSVGYWVMFYDFKNSRIMMPVI